MDCLQLSQHLLFGTTWGLGGVFLEASDMVSIFSVLLDLMFSVSTAALVPFGRDF